MKQNEYFYRRIYCQELDPLFVFSIDVHNVILSLNRVVQINFSKYLYYVTYPHHAIKNFYELYYSYDKTYKWYYLYDYKM